MDKIPADIVCEIIKYLSYHDLIKFSQTNKNNNQIVKSEIVNKKEEYLKVIDQMINEVKLGLISPFVAFITLFSKDENRRYRLIATTYPKGLGFEIEEGIKIGMFNTEKLGYVYEHRDYILQFSKILYEHGIKKALFDLLIHDYITTQYEINNK